MVSKSAKISTNTHFQLVRMQFPSNKNVGLIFLRRHASELVTAKLFMLRCFALISTFQYTKSGLISVCFLPRTIAVCTIFRMRKNSFDMTRVRHNFLEPNPNTNTVFSKETTIHSQSQILWIYITSKWQTIKLTIRSISVQFVHSSLKLAIGTKLNIRIMKLYNLEHFFPPAIQQWAPRRSNEIPVQYHRCN